VNETTIRKDFPIGGFLSLKKNFDGNFNLIGKAPFSGKAIDDNYKPFEVAETLCYLHATFADHNGDKTVKSMCDDIVEFIKLSQQIYPELVPEFKEFINRVDALMSVGKIPERLN